MSYMYDHDHRYLKEIDFSRHFGLLIHFNKTRVIEVGTNKAGRQVNKAAGRNQ